MSALTISRHPPTRPRLVAVPDRRSDHPPRAGARGDLHLTRRGRLAVFLTVLVLAAVAFVVGRASAGAALSGPAPTVTVGSGDTLWSLARRAEPRADTRDAVERLARLNHLDASVPLRAGRVLQLPRR
jgi:hypothetical protein